MVGGFVTITHVSDKDNQRDEGGITENWPVCCSGENLTWMTCMLLTGSFDPPNDPYPLIARMYSLTREFVVATRYILPDSDA